MEPPLWSEGASAWAHEREALESVRRRLPDHEPWRAWSNVEFLAEDGSVNEVDLVVVSPRGLWLVEIKSWPGVLSGDGQTWRHRWPDGRARTLEHPLILANRKAKRLRSLLARQPALRNTQVPWVQALVYLSSPELDCRLHDIGRIGVCGRDPIPSPLAPEPTGGGPTAGGSLPGIVAACKEPSVANVRGTAVNRPLSARIADAIDQAGLHPSNRGRKVGDWDLGALLDEGPGWQDFAATRPGMSVGRRVRVYLAGTATSAEDEQRLRAEATREFKVMADVTHEGIARPLELVQSERGPAVLFDRVDGEQRADLWAGDAVSGLDLAERVQLVRQAVEAVAHAHAQRVAHRALTARCVLARPGESGPKLVIGHWQSAARDLATQLTAHPSSAPDLGSELAERLSAEEQVYLAPETFAAEDPDGVSLDVFSLGALCVLLLSGRPPAGDLAERELQFDDYGGLSLDAAVDGMPSGLAEMVTVATDPLPGRRLTLREMLDVLDDALDELTAPAAAGEDAPGTGDPGLGELMAETDALAAAKGDRLAGGWEVLRRLGAGSTAVALLCTRPGMSGPVVLKVAKDEDHAERLRDEARVLGELHHAGIVELDGIDQVGGRTTLRLAPAGDPDGTVGMTLADRLAQLGPVGLDLLERFGDDLLDALAYLESEGVRHRDVKPDNLGVRPRRADRSPHLVLFDFSLARTPDTDLRAGTPGYLDPFLAERPGRRYDAAADRYAAAVTIHEMATGSRPRWGDGRSDPLRGDDEAVVIDPTLFDPAVRDAMVEFFATALARDPRRRFHTADQMRHAWRDVFATARQPTTFGGDSPDGEAPLAELVGAATAATPVGELGLSASAAAALERLGVGTAGQLAGYPPAEWTHAAGVGLRARREAADLAARLREHFGAHPPDPAASIDRLADQLIAKPTTDQSIEDREALRALLGLAATDDGDSGEVVAWPGPAELAAACGLGRAGYDELLGRARARWSKQPALTAARQDLARILERSGRVLAADDAVLALLAQRGSTASGAARRARGRAVLRAALETESARRSQRFTWRRLGGGATAVVALYSEDLDAEELADYTASLGRVADELASFESLPSPAAAAERLRRVAAPAGLGPLSDHRLVRLAAAASATAAVSGRLEVYPRRLSPLRAVRLARGALLSPAPLSDDDVRGRVATRFPQAQDLPERPALDRLLREEIGLVWHPGGPDEAGVPRPAGFVIPAPHDAAATSGIGTSGSWYRTGTALAERDEDRELAERTQDRLERSAKQGGYLVITVRLAQHARAVDQLAATGATVVDLDATVITALRALADERGIDWERAILAADAAGPRGPRWSNPFLGVVRQALRPLPDRLLHGPAHQLLVHPGLLGRYDRLGMLDELREAVTRRPVADQTLRTLWVLVPALDPQAPATVDGSAVPVTTAAERLALPDAWAKNLHRTQPSGSTT